MNERFKQLKDQCSSERTWDSEREIWIESVIDLEKFAISVVKECAELFPLTFTDEQYQRRIDKTIKKHFGIEE
jgi:hypothetical protein